MIYRPRLPGACTRGLDLAGCFYLTELLRHVHVGHILILASLLPFIKNAESEERVSAQNFNSFWCSGFLNLMVGRRHMNGKKCSQCNVRFHPLLLNPFVHDMVDMI